MHLQETNSEFPILSFTIGCIYNTKYLQNQSVFLMSVVWVQLRVFNLIPSLKFEVWTKQYPPYIFHLRRKKKEEKKDAHYATNHQQVTYLGYS